MAIHVRRSGRTVGKWTGDGKFEDMQPSDWSVYLQVSIPVTSGRSEVGIWIETDHFEQLASCMMKAAPKETLAAFAKAILADETK